MWYYTGNSGYMTSIGIKTESGDHEDYSEDDHEVNSPQTETDIGSTSHGTSVTQEESRALNEAKKRRLDKGKLVFEIDECVGRIIGQDSQRFITKGGVWKVQPSMGSLRGHLRGRSAPKKEILVVENLRTIVELEKNKSAALEEKSKEVTMEQDEMK
nr:hypothetical protein [Tanacetum cinerariifolium]